MPNTNPAWEAMQNVGSGYDERGHVYQYLNPYKTADLIIGSSGSDSLSSDNWGNWRIWGGKQIVPNNVVLLIEDPKIEFTIIHELAPAFEGLADKGFLKNVQGALEVARLATSLAAGQDQKFSAGGKFKSRYAKIPMWKDTSALQVTSPLTFKFNFGQYGLFSGEWEVVRPILTLASHFSLRQSPEHANYFIGPAPTLTVYLMYLFAEAPKAIGNIGEKLGAGLKEAAKAGGEGGFSAAANSVVGMLTDIEASIYQAMDSALGQASGLQPSSRPTPSPLQTISIRLGRLTLGSLIPKNIKWSFDFKNVDEYGFPMSGEFSIGEIEMIYYPLAGLYNNVFNG